MDNDGECESCGRVSQNNLSECGHQICSTCIQEIFANAIYQNDIKKVQCPVNKCPISTTDLQYSLTHEEFSEYLDLCLQEFMEVDDAQIIICPNKYCSNKMEKMPHNENDVKFLESQESIITQKGDDNRLLSRTGWVHFNLHRLRCPECGNNFCSLCSKMPYHLGLTCEQYEEYLTSRKCRFCEETLKADNCAPISSFKALLNCCNEEECLEKRELACTETLECGHFCGGVANEKNCLPCLEEDCLEVFKKNGKGISDVVPVHSKLDFCAICWVDTIGGEPSVLLKCGHALHYRCVRKVLKDKWATPHIGFSFSLCPLCKVPIDHPMLEKDVIEIDQLKKKVIELGMESLSPEDKQEISNPNSPYFNDPDNFILSKLSFYLCHTCQEPFYGGKLECNNLLNNESPSVNRDELLCKKCTIRIALCNNPSHHDYWTYKCRYCCKKAVWFCFGTHHFCDPCHNRAGELRFKGPDDVTQCAGQSTCPLKIKHPPNGEEYIIGCELCQEIFERSPEETKRIIESEKRRKKVDAILEKVMPITMVILGIYSIFIFYNNFICWEVLFGVLFVTSNILKLIPLFIDCFIIFEHFTRYISFTRFDKSMVILGIGGITLDILRHFSIVDEYCNLLGLISLFQIFRISFWISTYLLRIFILFSPAFLLLRIPRASFRFAILTGSLFGNILSYFYPFAAYEEVITGAALLFRLFCLYLVASAILYHFLNKFAIVPFRFTKWDLAGAILIGVMVGEVGLYFIEYQAMNFDVLGQLLLHFLLTLRLALFAHVPFTFYYWRQQRVYIRKKIYCAVLDIFFLMITDFIISYFTITWTEMFTNWIRFFVIPLGEISI